MQVTVGKNDAYAMHVLGYADTYAGCGVWAKLMHMKSC